MNPSRLWPMAIVGVLAITVGANAWILYEANRDPNATALEPDYYRKAVAWDTTMAQEDRDAALGWRLDARPAAYDPAGTPIAVTLADRDGAPLPGARVTITALHNLEGGRTVTGAGTTGPDGRVVIRLGLRRTGLWELRFETERGADRFTAVLHRDVDTAR